MKLIFIALIFSVLTSPVFAKAPRNPASLFPDAPPPPQIAPAPVAACCTIAGRFSWANPSKDQPPIEGAACDAKTADGLTQAGTICN